MTYKRPDFAKIPGFVRKSLRKFYRDQLLKRGRMASKYRKDLEILSTKGRMKAEANHLIKLSRSESLRITLRGGPRAVLIFYKTINGNTDQLLAQPNEPL